jgi:hypothetical protein
LAFSYSPNSTKVLHKFLREVAYDESNSPFFFF